MLQSTFQIAPGIGPAKEHSLWARGIACWDDLPPAPSVALSKQRDPALRAAVDEARAALSRGDADALAAMLPPGEHWRMFADFGDGAGYLDIETGEEDVAFAGISAIGWFDRHGPRIFLAGRDLDEFPSVARDCSMLVTFNGLSFDVPILCRAFPEWTPPRAHVDLRHVLARVGHDGGLKSIERELAELRLARPAHLAGVGGWDAGWLWRRGRGRHGDRDALRLFVEYNLHDVIHLRSLIAYAYNALTDRIAEPAVRARVGPVPVPARGDVLYDVSKILLSL